MRAANIMWYDKTVTMDTAIQGTFKSSMAFSEFPYDHQMLKLELQVRLPAKIYTPLIDLTRFVKRCSYRTTPET